MAERPKTSRRPSAGVAVPQGVPQGRVRPGAQPAPGRLRRGPRKLGLVEQTVYNWLRQERVDRGEREGLSTDERDEMTRLRREVKRLTMERDLLKRSLAFWVKELGQVSRYHHVDTMKAEGFPVRRPARRPRSRARPTTAGRTASCRPSRPPSSSKPTSSRRSPRSTRTPTATYGRPRVTKRAAQAGLLREPQGVERLMAMPSIAGVHPTPAVRTTLPAELAPPRARPGRR